MTREDYIKLFHRANANLVAFKQVFHCDEELRKMVEIAIADEREACAAQLDFNAQAASNGGDEYLAALLWQEAEEIRARGNT